MTYRKEIEDRNHLRLEIETVERQISALYAKRSDLVSRLNTAEQRLITKAVIEEAAEEVGLDVKINECEAGRVKYLHVMFQTGGVRLLDYWPSGGNGYDMLSRRTCVFASHDEAARYARKLSESV